MKTVLVVDDALTVRNLAKFSLSPGDYTVLEAGDGRAGLEVCSGNQVDLVIADLQMPGMGGLELARALRANPATRHIPIFLLTTDAREDAVLQGRELGILGWILKPFVPERLLGAVQKTVGR